MCIRDRRIIVSLTIGVTTGFCCWYFLRHFQQGAADFSWAIWGAQDLLAHHNPYDSTMQLYPLPAVFFGLPFVRLDPNLGAGTFFGISSALLAFGLSREGYHRLLVFLAYPYWVALIWAQWAPLIMAGAFFPLLLPATMAKPQLGLPVVLSYPSLRGYLTCAGVLALSLAILPSWPWLWLSGLHNYVRFIPLLILPGPLLALSLIRYHDRDARFLFLMALTPQRWFYDALLLWLIPKSRREILGTVAFSWILGIWRWYHYPLNHVQVGRWVVLLNYLPMLAVILARSRDPGTSERPPGHNVS